MKKSRKQTGSTPVLSLQVERAIELAVNDLEFVNVRVSRRVAVNAAAALDQLRYQLGISALAARMLEIDCQGEESETSASDMADHLQKVNRTYWDGDLGDLHSHLHDALRPEDDEAESR
jgi:hypothetical protein